MPDLFQQQSPLVQIDLGEVKGNAPAIREVPFLGYLNLRGRSSDTAFLAAVLKVLGCEPPIEANTMVESGNYRIYWLGPDEWLIVTPTGQQGGPGFLMWKNQLPLPATPPPRFRPSDVNRLPWQPGLFYPAPP